MPKKLRAGQFRGSWYLRQKQTDKWGNKYKSIPTWRQRGYNGKGGYIITDKGTFLGVEKNKAHSYGNDPKKVRKPATFVRPNRLGSIKSRNGHIRRLR